MTKSINATFAAALLVASVAGGSAAFAGPGDGEYYQGASRENVQPMMLDNYNTQSITNERATNSTSEQVPGDGDYYQGSDNEILRQ